MSMRQSDYKPNVFANPNPDPKPTYGGGLNRSSIGHNTYAGNPPNILSENRPLSNSYVPSQTARPTNFQKPPQPSVMQKEDGFMRDSKVDLFRDTNRNSQLPNTSVKPTPYNPDRSSYIPQQIRNQTSTMKPETRDHFVNKAPQNRHRPEKDFNPQSLSNLENADITICNIF